MRAIHAGLPGPCAGRVSLWFLDCSSRAEYILYLEGYARCSTSAAEIQTESCMQLTWLIFLDLVALTLAHGSNGREVGMDEGVFNKGLPLALPP